MTQPKGCIVPVLKRGWNQENDSDHTSVGQKYKTRLVAKDFTKKPNINYFDTFAPIIRIFSV